jgi:hypothetical protein
MESGVAKFTKLSKTSRMTRRTLPCINCLKIDTAKNRISLHVNDIVPIGFDSLRGFQICDKNRHANPIAPLAKNRNIMHVARKRSKRLRMSQGSILHTQNLYLRHGTQPTKNRKYLHVALEKCHRDQYYARTNYVCSILSNESPIIVS